MDLILIGLSLVLLLMASFLAFRAAKITGLRLIWGVIIAALFLMIIRRFWTIFDMVYGEHVRPHDPMLAWLVFAISFFLVAGISGISHLIARLRHSEERLKENTAELERANRQLKNFSAIVSHDLQTPLHTIIGFIGILKMAHSTALNDEVKDYLGRIERASHRMSELIYSLLDLAKIGPSALNPEILDPSWMLREIILDFEVRLNEVNGKIEVGKLPSIYADRLQIRQLFQNLIANGLKFARKGVPPCIRIEGLSVDPGFTEITVTDNGIGIPDQEIDSIFEPFKRLHGKTEFEGTGLGLTICKRIVQINGGTIRVRSRVGEGTSFIIKLPTKKQKSPVPSD